MIFNQRWAPLRGLSCCLGLFLLFCILLPLKCYTIEGAESNEDSPTLSAYIDGEPKIYLNDLSDSTLVTDSWVYNEIKTLHIEADLTGLESDSKYLKIQLPVGMNLQSTPESLIDGRTILSVDKTQFKQVRIPSSSSYAHIPNSGTLYYDLEPHSMHLSLDVLVSIDNVLWDMNNNSLSTYENLNAIEISIGDANQEISQKLDQVKVLGRNWDSYYSSSYPSASIANADINISNTLSINNIHNSTSRLHRKIVAIMEIPYYIKNSDNKEKQQASIKEVVVQNNGYYYIEDQYLVVVWENAYLTSTNFSVVINFQEDSLSEEVTATYNLEGLYIQNYFTEEFTQVKTPQTIRFTLIPNNIEKIKITTYSKNTSMDSETFNAGIVNYLGGFRIVNNGANTSPKKFTFEFPNGCDAGVGITSFRMITPKEAAQYSVDYTLWDSETFREYTSSLKINKQETSNNRSGYLLTTNQLASDYMAKNGEIDTANLYLKEISYTVNSIPRGFENSGGYYSHDSGNSHGVVLKNHALNEKYYTYMTISSLDELGNTTPESRSSFYTIVVGQGESTGGLNSFSYRDKDGNPINNITAGSNFFLTGNAIASSYPYYSTAYLSSPKFYLRLPRGVSLKLETSTFELVTGSKTTPLTARLSSNSPRQLRDGSSVYEIEFLDDFGIGYYTKSLSEFGRLKFKIELSTTKSTKTLSLNIRDTLFIADSNISLKGGGSWNAYFVKDSLDINNNGTTSDQLATFDKDVYFSVTSNGTWLETDLSLSVNNTTSPDFHTTIHKTDELAIKFSINNSNGGYVLKDDFYYLIPIPKKNIGYSPYFKAEDETFDFDLELIEFPKVVDGFEVLYSTDNKVFFSASSVQDLSAITMVKIIPTKDIQTSISEEFVFKLKYVEDSILNQGSSGNDVVWGAYGYQKYMKNGAGSSFLHVFDKIKIELLEKGIFSSSPSDLTLREGDVASFSVSISDWGIPAAKGHWQYRTSSTSHWIDTPATQLTYSIDQVGREMNGYQYRYVLENKAGVVCSEPATLGVYGLSISIPKTIQLPLNASQAPYQISVTGTLPTGKSVEIYPIHADAALRTFELQEVASIKPPISARVFQDQTLIRNQELHLTTPTYLKGRIQLSNLSAGSWTGSFNFYINFD